jgi:hypothetical protein
MMKPFPRAAGRRPYCGRGVGRAARLLVASLAGTAVGACDRGLKSTADLGLRLPFQSGSAYAVIQGRGGWAHSGKDEFAWDFDLPEGTPVVAAASGTVVEVIEHFDTNTTDREGPDTANVVMIDHGGARFSVYRHLQQRSAVVHEGDRVRQGEVVARSGNTGVSLAPHLHFAVIDHLNRTLPLTFIDVKGGIPEVGERYAAREQYPSDGRAPDASSLPKDTFAANGILLDDDVPAHLLVGDRPLVIRGHVSSPSATRVVGFFMPRGEDREILHLAAANVEGAGNFTLHIDLAAVEGQLDFVMTVPDAQGRMVSSFSVPVLVRRGHEAFLRQLKLPVAGARATDDRAETQEVAGP